MPQTVLGFLFLAILATPAPQPELKTIVTVHSSEFCTALVLAVRPALVGLMRNDQLIGLGRSTLAAGDRDSKFGGTPQSSFNQQGAAKWTPNSGDIEMLDARQRQLAAAMQYNIETVETVLENPNAPSPGGDDKAKLASIKSQLRAIADQQRVATNIIAGNAGTAELAGLFNSSAATGIESDNPSVASTTAGLNGISPLGSRLTTQNNVAGGPQRGKIETTEPIEAQQTSIAQSTTSMPFYSPYEKLMRALEIDQRSIGRSEATLSKTIVDAAEGCQ